MSKEDVMKYVMNSPYNTNPTILSQLLDGADNSKNGYNYIKQIADYLFETQYSTANIDYDYANNYFRTVKPAELEGLLGACTGVYKDGKVLRHLDYYYDHNAEFVVHRTADPEAENYVTQSKGIHASIGVASGIRGLTKEVVESGAYNEKYKMVPFDMTDGINDAGVYIQVNVVQRNYNDTEIVYDINPDAEKQCAGPMVIRYVLDHCGSFEDIEYFFNNTHIYATDALKFGFHYLVAIDDVWKIIELTADGHVTITEGIGENQMPHGIMANFRTFGLTFNNDEVQWESVEKYGMGLERYAIALQAFADTPKSLDELRSELKYSHLYVDEPQTWKTEICGEESAGEGSHLLTVMDIKNNEYATEVATKLATEKANFAAATRDDNKGVWTTTHSSIYDLATKSFVIAIQERLDEKYEFSLESPVAANVPQTTQTDYPTAAEFNALLTSLKNAGLMVKD